MIWNLFKCVKISWNIKFLGLIINDSQLWKAPIDQLMSNLRIEYFVIRTIQAIISPEFLRKLYFAYIHSVMNYGIIFWWNQPYSDKIIKYQKRMIRIITNTRMRNSSRELFKKLEVLFKLLWVTTLYWVVYAFFFCFV